MARLFYNKPKYGVLGVTPPPPAPLPAWHTPGLASAPIVSARYVGLSVWLSGCLAVYLTAAAFVDECTSAVSVDVERRLYQAAIEMGITSITISQRLALTEFHENELRLGEVTDAGWSLHACKHGGTAPAHMRLRTRYSAARC